MWYIIYTSVVHVSAIGGFSKSVLLHELVNFILFLGVCVR